MRAPASLCLIPFLFFFFNATSTTEIYTLSLHDALPIFCVCFFTSLPRGAVKPLAFRQGDIRRSEEHTSELQSRVDLVCRLLLEKKNGVRRRLRVDHAPRDFEYRQAGDLDVAIQNDGLQP